MTAPQPSMDNVEMFPNFKDGETAAEFFHDLYLMALKNPEQFAGVVLCYEERRHDDAGKVSLVRLRHASNLDTAREVIGVLEEAKFRCLRNQLGLD